MGLLSKIFKSENSRNVSKLDKIAYKVEALEEEYKKLTDEQLRAKTEEFKTRMGEEFEFMVTPLVFDLELNIDSKDFEIVKIYGSDTANEDTGNIMNVNTLFPSKTNEDGEVKGGVVLLKLNKINDVEVGNIDVSVSYKDRTGKEFSNKQTVNFENVNT